MEYLLFLLPVFPIWGLVQNNKTFNDREKIRNYMFEQPNWRELLLSYDTVRYNTHLWYRVTFRSPWRLYPEELRP